jgi:hypothetical protein
MQIEWHTSRECPALWLIVIAAALGGENLNWRD